MQTAGDALKQEEPPLELESVVGPATPPYGLTAKYFDRPDLHQHRATRTDLQIDPSLKMPGGIDANDGFSVRWSGYIQVPRTSVRTFELKISEPPVGFQGTQTCSVAINDVIVYRANKTVSWSDGKPEITNRLFHRIPVRLDGSRSYRFIVTQSTTYRATSCLRWGVKGSDMTPIPGRAFAPAVASTPGLKDTAESYSTTNGPTSVCFYWHEISPGTAYRVYKAAAPGRQDYDSPLVGDPSPDGQGYVSFHENALRENTKYYYTVKAAYRNPVTGDVTESNPSVDCLGCGSRT